VPPCAAKVVFGYATFTTLLGTVAVLIVRAPAIVALYAWVAVNGVGTLLSATWAVKLKGPTTVGVPLMAPPELIVIPAGSAPVMIVQV